MLDIRVGTLDIRVRTLDIKLRLGYAKNVPETTRVSLNFESCGKNNQLEIKTSRGKIVRNFSDIEMRLGYVYNAPKNLYII